MIPTRSTGAGRVRSVVVRIEALPGGLMRVSAPDATGWAAAARTPAELARAVTAALTEADIAAYSGARGRVYDGPDRKPGARRRSDTYDPAAWRVDDLGRLVSPSGKAVLPRDVVGRAPRDGAAAGDGAARATRTGGPGAAGPDGRDCATSRTGATMDGWRCSLKE